VRVDQPSSSTNILLGAVTVAIRLKRVKTGTTSIALITTGALVTAY
jgi:hypothetical protein